MTKTTRSDTSGGYRAVSAVLFVPVCGTSRRDRPLADPVQALTTSTSRRRSPGNCGRSLVSQPASPRSRSLVAAHGYRSADSCLSARSCSRSARSQVQLHRPSARSPRRSCPSAPESRSSRPRARLPRPSGWRRAARTLSWALIGQPAAWIVGMPLLGLVGGQNWRYAWLVLPLATALLAGAAVARHGGNSAVSAPPLPMQAALAACGVGRWLAAEMLANTAWAGTLVYAGVLFVESYQVSSAATGGMLAFGAGAYVSGNLAFRRLVGREPTRVLVRFSVVLTVATALFGAFRPSLLASVAFFSVAAFAAGARTLASSTFGLSIAPEFRQTAMAMRAASVQFGYFTGSFAAGAALAVGGYGAFGAAGERALPRGRRRRSPPSDRNARRSSASPRLPARVRRYRLFTAREADQPGRGGDAFAPSAPATAGCRRTARSSERPAEIGSLDPPHPSSLRGSLPSPEPCDRRTVVASDASRDGLSPARPARGSP